MEEEYFQLSTLEETKILAKCSALITRESWQLTDEGKVIVYGPEMWRSYGLYADHPYDFRKKYSGELIEFVKNFKIEFPEEWYCLNVLKDSKPEKYEFTEEDLTATDWCGW